MIATLVTARQAQACVLALQRLPTVLLHTTLHQHVYRVFEPPEELTSGSIVASPAQVLCAVSLLKSIIDYAPPDPAFICTVLRPVLPQLFVLHAFLAASAAAGKHKVRDADALDAAKATRELLGTWLRLAEADEAAAFLSDGRDSLLRRARAGIGEPGAEEGATEQCYWVAGPAVQFG
jgi:hypothetical protein